MELRLRNKISTKQLETLIHFGIILIAGLSTILRPSIESNITLFRVILPFLFIWLLLKRQRRAVKFSILIFFFLCYSILVSYISRFSNISIIFNLYYITVFFFYFYYKEVLKICEPLNLYYFLAGIFRVLIFLGFVQYFFGGVYFNTQDRAPAVNIFFWNENEYASVLAIFAPLFFLKEKGLFKYLWLTGAVYLIAFNGARLAILSLIIFFGGYFIIKFKIFKAKYIGLVFLAVFGALLLFFLKDYAVHEKYTIERIISNLTEHIISRTPLEHIGTFNARSNAVILGLKEFFDSYMLGIGPGNSLLMMDEIVVPGTEHYTALSMHNFTLQIVTETGLFGLGMMGIFLLKVKNAANASFYPANLVYVFYLSCLVSITLLSGAWANYFYLFIMFYAVDFFGKNV